MLDRLTCHSLIVAAEDVKTRVQSMNGFDASGRATPSPRENETPSAGSRRFGWSFRPMRRNLGLDVTVDARTASDLRKIGLILDHPRLVSWFAAGLLILLIWQRCPTVLSRARFWAEDGWVWYPQCYADGWRCLIIDHSSYLQTLSMSVALLSQAVPLTEAPKVFAGAALLIQAAPAIFLLSPRMARAIPALPVRVALALLLVAIPGMSEVYVNLTNAQWHLALLAFLVVCTAPALNWPQRIFDTLVLLVSGLSGPFAPVLLPVALLWLWLQRDPWQLWRLAVVAATAAIQISLIIAHGASRHPTGPGLGWSLGRLINIVVTNILGVAAFGRTAMIDHYWLVGEGWLSNGSLAATTLAGGIMAGALLLAIIAFLRGPWLLRAFLIFTGLEFATSLTDGLTLVQPLWVAMEGWIGMRYYFHPIAAWLAVLVTLVCDRNPALRSTGVALIAITLVFAIPADWELPKFPTTAFHQEAKAFETAPLGTVMAFPIPPIHDMVLVKH
jgi:hypothetical protein